MSFIKHTISFGDSKVGRFCKKHRTGLLTTGEIAGFVTTVVLACNSTTKLEQLKQEGKVGDTPKEVAKTYAFLYWPPVVTGLATAGLIGYSNNKFAKNIEATSAALTLTNAAYSRLQTAMQNTVGDKKAKEVNTEADKIGMKDIPTDNSLIEKTGFGETLFYDAWSGRYFFSTKQAVEDAFNEENRLLLIDGYVSLNTLYELLKINTCESGRFLGFISNSNRDLINYEFTSQITDNPAYPTAMVINYYPINIEDWA